MLDQFKLINRFWNYRRSYQLTSLQADIFFALVHECNQRRWENPFLWKNEGLTSLTGIKETALKDSRNKLADIGLIGYNKGIRNVKPPCYKLYNSDEEFFADFPDFNSTVIDAFLVVKRPRTPPIIGSNINRGNEIFASIEASEAGIEKNSSTADPDPLPDQRFAQEKEKSCAQKEKESDEAPVQHWRAIVGEWFAFNETHVHIRPSFKGRDPKLLRDILQLLQKRSTSAGRPWTETEAVEAFSNLLENAWHDSFLKKKFLLKNIEEQYDAIISHQHSQIFTAMPAGRSFQSATVAEPLRGRAASFTAIRNAQRPGSANRSQ